MCKMEMKKRNMENDDILCDSLVYECDFEHMIMNISNAYGQVVKNGAMEYDAQHVKFSTFEIMHDVHENEYEYELDTTTFEQKKNY